MKKFMLAAFAALLAIGATSCLKESKNESTVSKTVKSYALYTPLDGSDACKVGTQVYEFTVKHPDNTIQVSTNGMAVTGGTMGSFTTVAMPFESKFFNVDGKNCEYLEFESKNASSTGGTVTELDGILTQAVYLPGQAAVPGIDRAIPSESMHYVNMQYVLDNNWLVRTFWPDVTFLGTTKTSMPGQPNLFSTDEMRYRVVMRFNGDKTTADLVLYNARFAEQMKELTIVLKDLEVKFDKSGYHVSGQNTVPYMIEAGELQENAKYIFNQFNLDVVGDLTECTCSYRVAGVFGGSFEGEWMIDD